MNGINVLKDSRETFTPSTMWNRDTERRLSVNQVVVSEVEKPVGGLALAFPASGTVRKTFLLHKVTQSAVKIPSCPRRRRYQTRPFGGYESAMGSCLSWEPGPPPSPRTRPFLLGVVLSTSDTSTLVCWQQSPSSQQEDSTLPRASLVWIGVTLSPGLGDTQALYNSTGLCTVWGGHRTHICQIKLTTNHSTSTIPQFICRNYL